MSQDVAVVTGSSSGLGYEICSLLGERGRAVVGVSRTEIDLVRDGYAHVAGDVSDPRTVERAFAAADELGPLTTVVSCAGFGVFGDPGSYTRADVDDVLAGNLVGTILFADKAFARFNQQGSGTIVNVMSTAAHAARPAETVYTAAKWGARGYTDALRAAAKGTKVRVVGIYPGGMATPFWDNARGMEADTSGFASPREVALSVLGAIEERETSYVTDLLVNRI